MLSEIYNRIYNNKRKEKLELYLSPEIEDHYSKILKDIETGRKEANNTLSDFLNFSLDIPYPKMISVEKLPIIKYKGRFYPILGEEDGEFIRINKAFYTTDFFPLIIDFDENAIYTLPIYYRLKDDLAYTTISHEFLHHALRDRMINEALVHKLSKNK
ncbi:MAG: hypothetical protein QXJ96_02895 [Candidatus Aenigmatarchaeota archaeon]|nr:hypothetical protein [Candidatus Aenigmarchaeota archaeon]